MARMILCCPLALLLFTGCRRDDETPPPEGVTMKLTSPAFAQGEPIPRKYAGDGENKSPPLKWSKAPSGVKSFALMADDPRADKNLGALGNLEHPRLRERTSRRVPTDASFSTGMKQGKNDVGGVGYSGPDPPPGKPHRYFFNLYALDAALDLKEGSATKSELEQAMKGHIIGHGQLMGTYQK